MNVSLLHIYIFVKYFPSEKVFLAQIYWDLATSSSYHDHDRAGCLDVANLANNLTL